METWFLIATIVVAGGFIETKLGQIVDELKGQRLASIARNQLLLRYLETSQQTRQRGIPEQERGSDDTG